MFWEQGSATIAHDAEKTDEERILGSGIFRRKYQTVRRSAPRCW